jgi:WXXGXW repeat (2 copies)
MTFTRTKLLCSAAILSMSVAAPAWSQVHVYIGTPPPPIRYENRPPFPGEGFVWVDGYWGTVGNRYQWVSGRWDRPPYAGAYWSHPHYDHYDRGWQVHEGHWDHEDHGGNRDRDRDNHDHGRPR